MSTVHAIYENGVFRPIEPVDLPEGTRVLVDSGEAPTPAVESARRRVYETLSHCYEGGDSQASERHNEHQP